MDERIVDINNEKEWKVLRGKIESAMRELGESVRVVRGGDTGSGFTCVILERGLNIKYDVRDGSVTIWGVGKRYSNGYITYDKLSKKVETLTELMIGAWSSASS